MARQPSHNHRSEEQRAVIRWQLSWSFAPLRRLSPSESTPRRLATPTTFRPQGFTPSRRLAPRSNARPCFMPVTSLGFRSPGAFPRCQVHPARHRLEDPPGVFSSALHSKLRNASAPASPQTHLKDLRHEPIVRLQGFAPTADPYRRWTVTSEANGRSPPELSPPLQGLANVFRPRRASRVPLLRLLLLLLKQPIPGQARNRPQRNRGALQRFRPKTPYSAPRSRISPLEVLSAFPRDALRTKSDLPYARRPIERCA
jgi:hypothetical protein